MENWEFLKVLYEELYDHYRFLLVENYKLYKEKVKAYLWVNIAILSATGFLIKFFGKVDFLTVFLVVVNLFSIYSTLEEYSKDRVVPASGAEELLNWLYEEIFPLETKEESFYIALINNLEESIKKESRSREKIYRFFMWLLVIQFLLIGAILFTGGS